MKEAGQTSKVRLQVRSIGSLFNFEGPGVGQGRRSSFTFVKLDAQPESWQQGNSNRWETRGLLTEHLVMGV